MSDPLKLNQGQKSQVQVLGFCDPTFKSDCDAADDGVVYLKDQSSSYTSLDGYAEAFKILAGLGGKADAIDSADLKKLKDRRALADVISKDPALAVLRARKSGLEFGRRELPRSASGKPLPPRDYRRFLAYLQMALQAAVDPKVKADGNYSDIVRRAVRTFQTALGINLPDGSAADGKLMGAGTIGPLIMRLRYGKEELLAALEADRNALANRGGFFMGDAKGDVQKSAQQHAADAFRWLGYMDEAVDIETAEGKRKTVETLQERFREEGDAVGPNMVGPKIMGKIIDRVKAVEP